MPGFQATLWVGFMAPENTRAAAPITMTQAEFTAFMEAEVAKWAKVIKANHIAPVE